MMPPRPTVEREGDAVVIRIPMTLKQRGGRKEVLVPEGLPPSGPSKSPTQEPLVTALARAHVWQEMLESGRYDSIAARARARALDVDRAYVSRTLRLTFLAPDIVQSIIRGDEPSGLSLNRLTSGLPMLWSEQREALGLEIASRRRLNESPTRRTPDSLGRHSVLGGILPRENRRSTWHEPEGADRGSNADLQEMWSEQDPDRRARASPRRT